MQKHYTMVDHELVHCHPAALLHEDLGESVDVQPSDQPSYLVEADLQSTDQVVITSSPDWHEVDQLGHIYAIGYNFS